MDLLPSSQYGGSNRATIKLKLQSLTFDPTGRKATLIVNGLKDGSPEYLISDKSGKATPTPATSSTFSSTQSSPRSLSSTPKSFGTPFTVKKVAKKPEQTTPFNSLKKNSLTNATRASASPATLSATEDGPHQNSLEF